MQIILIRHGATPGNLKKRYVGRTDESLSEEGQKALLREGNQLDVIPDRLFLSPMKRCLETADLLFPGMEQEIVPDLRECDFGEFEYRNYLEMKDDPLYNKWIGSGGTDPFPDGESPAEFRKRSVKAFMETMRREAIQGRDEETVVFVVHGGTIMAVMAALAVPRRGYFDWQIGNAKGYIFEVTGSLKDDHFLRRTGRIGFGEETGA